MKQSKYYIFHVRDFETLSGDLFFYKETVFESSRLFSLEDIKPINELNASLILFFPALDVSSYVFKRKPRESQACFENRFYEEYGDNIVNDFSNQSLVENSQDGIVYLIDANKFQKLDQILKKFLGEVFLYPENFLLTAESEADAYEVFGRCIFLFPNKLCLGCYKQQESIFLAKAKEAYPDWQPRYLMPSGINDSDEDSLESNAELKILHHSFIRKQADHLPNFYSRDFDVNQLKRFLYLNKGKLALVITILFILVALPMTNRFLLQKFQQKYKTASLKTLQLLDPNIRQLINVKAQYQRLNQDQKTNNMDDLTFMNAFDHLEKIALFLKAIKWDANEKTIVLFLKEKPDLKLKVLINILKSQKYLQLLEEEYDHQLYIKFSLVEAK